MLRKFVPVLLSLFIILVYNACGKGARVISKESKDLTDIISVESKHIQKNRINDNGVRNIRVDLPPDYYTSTRTYPVVYYFHGYGRGEHELSRMGIVEIFNDSFLKNKLKSFILVSVNCNNRYGGNFYVNSKMAGNWEDYFILELIPLIDQVYRTIPEKSARCLAGFSMGGFGVLHIGLNHPEYFSGIWAFCPGLFSPDNGLEKAFADWRNWPSFKPAYGAAFANDSENFPQFDNTPQDNKLKQLWSNGFGGWDKRIEAYKAANSRLRIKIVIAENDEFQWIIDGSQYLHEELSQNNIESEFSAHPVGHFPSKTVFGNDALVFFQDVLKF